MHNTHAQQHFFFTAFFFGHYFLLSSLVIALWLLSGWGFDAGYMSIIVHCLSRSMILAHTHASGPRRQAVNPWANCFNNVLSVCLCLIVPASDLPRTSVHDQNTLSKLDMFGVFLIDCPGIINCFQFAGRCRPDGKKHEKKRQAALRHWSYVTRCAEHTRGRRCGKAGVNVSKVHSAVFTAE